MSGIRQHFLSRFLQKGFASKTQNGSIFTWFCQKGSEPKEISINDIGVSKYFYGKEEDGLDNKITLVENDYSVLVDNLRAISNNCEVREEKLFEFLAHLNFKSRYFRESIIGELGGRS